MNPSDIDTVIDGRPEDGVVRVHAGMCERKLKHFKFEAVTRHFSHGRSVRE
jgi:hypothetical protein